MTPPPPGHDPRRQDPRSRPAGVLYAEDFDDPPPAAAPEPPPEPIFDVAQMAAARHEGFAAGMQAGEAQARQTQQEATAAALAAIAAAMQTADEAAARTGEQCAEALAGLLLACLRRALPELCRLYGVGEARAVARALLPGLLHEPQVTVRADAATADAVAAEIAGHDPDLAARLRLQPIADMTPGDVRISWANGDARRDVAALWRAIAATLQQASLQLPADAAPHAPTPPATRPGDRRPDDAHTPATIAANGQTQELEHAG